MATRHAITATTVFTGSDESLTDSVTVIWQDRDIVWVGPDDAADLSGVELLHSGGFVVPGLIDAHVHLCLDATMAGVEAVATDPIDQIEDRADRNAAKLLRHGITCARDMGSRDGVAIGVAQRQRAGLLVGAHIVAAGRGITPTGGHGWMVGVHADGAQAVAAAVATEIRHGAEAIKLFPTGGVLGSGSHGEVVTMSTEEVAAAVEVAHAENVLVAAHVVGTAGVDVALDGGVDTIEHAVGLSAEQARRCADEGVALVPTLTAVEMLQRHAEELPADVRRRTEEVAQRHAAGIATAIEAGATVLAGTDAGTPFNHPGSLVTELEILARLGLGAAGALRAATGRAAAALGLPARGRVQPGCVADLVVVDADPIADLGALGRPRLVVQDGRTRQQSQLE